MTAAGVMAVHLLRRDIPMKLVLTAAALAISAAAAAQTPPDPTMESGQVVAPSNANPEVDARGIPVISAPAEVPAGANEAAAIAPGARFVPNPNQQQVFASRPSQEAYPPCSRTVTDNCVQTYERGAGRPN